MLALGPQRVALAAGGGVINLNNLHLMGLRSDTPTILDSAKASLGVVPSFVHQFLSDKTTTFAQAATLVDSIYATWAGRTDVMFEWAVPIASPSETMADVGAGVYDAALRLIFQKIAAGVPSSQKVIFYRPGHEQMYPVTGSPAWPWSVTTGPNLGPLYIAAFRRAVLIARSVDPRFKATLCLCPGQTDYQGNFYDPWNGPNACYPGDDVVDVIGEDSYHVVNDFTSAVNGANLFDVRFNIEPGNVSINYAQAVAHGKPWAFPEWGISNDDPELIRLYYLWMRGKNIAYHGYWDKGKKGVELTFACKLSIDTGGVVQYPLSKAEFTKQANTPIFVTPAALAVPTGNMSIAIDVNKDGCTLSIVGAANGYALSGNILFATLAAGTSTVTLRVTDELGLYSDRTFTLTAAASNIEPEVAIANLRATVAPTSQVQAAQSALVSALKAAGYWALTDALYVPVNDNQQAGYIDLKASRYDANTLTGTPLFRYRGGAHGDGSAALADAGLTPNSLGRNIGKNSGFIGALFLTDLPNGAVASIDVGAGSSLYIQRTAAGTVLGRMMSGSDIAIGGAKTLPAWIALARDDVNGGRSFVNDVPTTWTQAVARFAYDTLKLHGNGPTTSAFGVNDIGLVIVGASPSPAQAIAISQAANAYKAAVMALPELGAKRLFMLEADRRDLFALSVDSITSMTDIIGAKAIVQATSAQQAKWLANGWGGGPGVVMTASTFMASASDPLNISGAPDIEIWALIQNTETVSGAPLRVYFAYGSGSFDSDIRLSRGANNGIYTAVIGKGGSAVMTATGPVDSGLAKTVVRTIIKPTSVQVEVDGAVGAQIAGVPAIVAGSMRIGGLAGATSCFVGNSRVPAIVTQSLTTGEATQLRNFLSGLK